MNRPALERAKKMCAELAEQGEPIEMHGWGYLNTNSCGTIGCLAGWMTLDAELREMGLRNRDDLKEFPGDRDSLRPCFAGRSGGPAMSEFLRVGQGQELYLFSGVNENSWSAAAERIQDVLDGRA